MITKLINKDLISLNLKATTKDGVFIEMIDMLKKQGRISDSEAFLNDVKAREAIGAYFGLSGHLFRFHPARRFGVIRPA